MSVKVKNNSQQINNAISIKANVFLRTMADEIVKISTPITPKKTGELRRSVLKSVLGLSGTIKWVKNYAIFLEVKKFKNYTTAGTSNKFAETGVRKGAKKTAIIAKRVGLV